MEEERGSRKGLRGERRKEEGKRERRWREKKEIRQRMEEGERKRIASPLSVAQWD